MKKINLNSLLEEGINENNIVMLLNLLKSESLFLPMEDNKVMLLGDEESDDKVISEIAKKNNCSNISTFFFWENRKKIKIVTLKFKNLEEKKSFLSEIKKIIDQKQKQK